MDTNTLKVMFSSEKEEWGTPQDLFDELNKEFNFNIDVCALPQNNKCENYYSPEIDGLKQNWLGSCWMNPPYGKNINKWIEKAYTESLKGSTVVALIPSRTDTKYWHDYIMKSEEIRFVKGRLKFGNSNNSAPFPSAIIIFSNHNKLNPDIKTYDPKLSNINKPRTINPFYHEIRPIRRIDKV